MILTFFKLSSDFLTATSDKIVLYVYKIEKIVRNP